MARVLTPETFRCRMHGKAAFPTRGKAEEIIARGYTRPNRTGKGRELAKRAYLGECGWWHLAHSHLRDRRAA